MEFLNHCRLNILGKQSSWMHTIHLAIKTECKLQRVPLKLFLLAYSLYVKPSCNKKYSYCILSQVNPQFLCSLKWHEKIIGNISLKKSQFVFPLEANMEHSQVKVHVEMEL